MKENIVGSLKRAMKESKMDKVHRTTNPNAIRERDMRQEAMDMGSHNANEFFGAKNEPTN